MPERQDKTETRWDDEAKLWGQEVILVSYTKSSFRFIVVQWRSGQQLD